MSTPPVAHPIAARHRRTAAFVLVGLLALTACSSNVGNASPTTDSPTTDAVATTSTTLPSTTTSTTTTTTLPPTTTTEPIVTTPGIVRVANASGINGAAGVLSDELAAVGFDTRKATNAAGIYENLDASLIFVIPGSEAVAQSISRLMGDIEVRPMTTPAWITGGTEGLGDATVLVMLGHDRAGTPLAAIRG